MTVLRATVRYNHELGEFELRCEDCAAKTNVAAYWPLALEFWDPKRGMVRCRACGLEQDAKRKRAKRVSAEYQELERERIAKWRADHPDYARTMSRIYRSQHTDQRRAADRAYHVAHREERVAAMRERRRRKALAKERAA